MFLEDYNYVLPKEMVAKRPASPRDSARLFVYDTSSGNSIFDTFSNLARHIPPRSLFVFNETKVVPARMALYKETGGRAEILLLMNEWVGSNLILALSDRRIDIGSRLFLEGKPFFSVVGQDENVFKLKFLGPIGELSGFLKKNGHMPLPKYIKDVDLPERELRKSYQTIFARGLVSVAAPTASLHFTKKVFRSIEKIGASRAFINLRVGLGTFSPLTDKNFLNNRLHREFFSISAGVVKKILESKNKSKPVVAVGTTVVRGLESASGRILSGQTGKIYDQTEIFIKPPFDFKLTDILITNFHLPKSSLMMLVEAFLRFKKAPDRLVGLYKTAIQKNMRFYSFGDCMLIK